MKKHKVRKRVSALLMAISLAATGNFAGVMNVKANEESIVETVLQETVAEEQEATEQSIQATTQSQLQETTQETVPTESLLQESTFQSETQEPSTSAMEASHEDALPEEILSTSSDSLESLVADETSEQSTSEPSNEEFTEETSLNEKESSTEVEVVEIKSTEEESLEEESTEEESTEEESTEDDFEIALLDLGDVTQIVQITSCRIEGTQVVIKGKLNHQFKTSDDKLYLFAEPMYQKDVVSTPVAQVKKEDSFSFSIPLNNNTEQSRLYSKFFVGIKFKDGTYQALSDGYFITNPEALAANQSAYPQARSKKGLLTDTAFGTDIDELGLSYTNVNITINDLLGGGGFSYTYNGKTYQYSSSYVSALDQILRVYQRNNMIVNAILLWRPDGNAHSFGYPGANAAIGNYHGWNVVSKEGIECVSAAIHFLGERYGRSDNEYGHIAGWIVGNEANADTEWNYTGHQQAPEYAYIYSNMMRITSQAVRSSCAHARIYMSLDMYWHGVSGGRRYDGKELVDYVNTYMKAEGDINWGVAFHPYGNPLTEAEWWNDNATFNENATFISMQNISVLTGYLCKGGLRNPDGSVKHVILSEQGYTSYSNNQGNVEWKQAAAYAYAYYVTEANPYIDAFIAMREIDAKPEADTGLHQGLWYNDENKAWCTFAKKPAWTVWKYIDTDQSFSYTDSLAPIVGLSSFSSTYGSVMAAKNRSVDLGNSGYATSYQSTNSLQNGWYGEYSLTACNADSQKISVTAGANSPFTYAGIARQGTVDFSSQRYFCFSILGTAGNSQNLRVRMRFTSGQNILETEIALKKNVNQMIYADLGNWKGKNSVSKIQIWVQQDGTQNWQNGSFTITNVCQSSSIGTTTAPSLTIKESGYTDVTATGFSAYCKVTGTKPLARVEYSAWNIAASTETTVTKQGSISNDYSKCTFSISEFGCRTGAYGVRIVAYDTDNVASKPVLVSVTVKSAAEALVIYNAYTSNISYSGFNLTVEASSDYGLSGNSTVAVWSSTAGQSKTLVWYPLHFVNGKATIRVNIANHGNWTGEYNCHAFVTDNIGTKKIYALTESVPTPDPKITKASVTEVSAIGYHIEADFECPRGFSVARVKTWSEKNGEKAAKTSAMVVSGAKGSIYIATGDHGGQSGTYHSVIYLYDAAGQCATRTIDIRIPEDLAKWERVPKITASCTGKTQKSYRISFSASSYMGCKSMRIASWTEENGQDDLVWRDVSFNVSSTSGYIDIPVTTSKKGGSYINDIYIWDQAGQVAGCRVIVQIPSRMPKILKIMISDITKSGYRVKAQFETPVGGTKVLMPTWTRKNGQDDLVWHKAKISGNIAECYVPVSNHKNETGEYITHVYVYDKDGDYTIEGTDIVIDSGANNGYTGLLLQDGIWKYYQNGTVASSYTNLTYYNGAWFYVKNGVIDWNHTGLCLYNGIWYYVKNGVLDWNYTGLSLNGAWYYVKKGVVDWTYTGLCLHNGVWYYVKNGKLDWNYTGLCLHNGAWYYVKKGVLDWNHTGLCLYNGAWYYVKNGVLDWNYTGLSLNGAWYYVKKGVVDWTYTGLCLHNGAWYYVKNGKLDWNYTGECTSQGKTYIVKGGVAKPK